MSSTIASAGPIAAAPPRRRARSPFYAALGLLMIALALAGFWPQYYGALVTGVIPPSTRHWLIHLHSTLFLAWLAMFLVQAGLVWRGRIVLHRRLGPFFAVYGFVIAAIGLLAGFALAARFGRNMGDMEKGAEFVFAPTIDMVFLAAFLAAALVWRNQRERHRRAMLVATFSIAVVGIGRLLAPIENPWLWQPLTLAPLLLAFGYDLVFRRRLYAVLVAGLFVHWLRLNQEVYTTTEAWRPIGRALIAPFA
jgi:hypothetical protein